MVSMALVRSCALPAKAWPPLLACCCLGGCCMVQEATDTYKALLLDHRDLLALNVYVALCYAKLDFYDVSTEILQVVLGAGGAREEGSAWGHRSAQEVRLDGARLLPDPPVTRAQRFRQCSLHADMVPCMHRTHSVRPCCSHCPQGDVGCVHMACRCTSTPSPRAHWAST